jgi:hypothetical protein
LNDLADALQSDYALRAQIEAVLAKLGIDRPSAYNPSSPEARKLDALALLLGLRGVSVIDLFRPAPGQDQALYADSRAVPIPLSGWYAERVLDMARAVLASRWRTTVNAVNRETDDQPVPR